MFVAKMTKKHYNSQIIQPLALIVLFYSPLRHEVVRAKINSKCTVSHAQCPLLRGVG